MITSNFDDVFNGLRNVRRVNDYTDSKTGKTFACYELTEKSAEEWNALASKQNRRSFKATFGRDASSDEEVQSWIQSLICGVRTNPYAGKVVKES